MSNALQHLFDNNRTWAERMEREQPGFFSRLANQQSPKYLWIGCSDSRVPANTVTGTRPDASDTQKYLHRGLAFRSFSKQIPLAEHIEVRDAHLEHGVLSVSVVRVVPEKDRKRTIAIGNSASAITA